MYKERDVLLIGSSFKFLLGVNYWPRKLNIRMWRDWDEKAIEENERLMKSLGIRAVRFFIKDEDFADESADVYPYALERLRKFLDMLNENGIAGFVSLIVGHMSGKNWRIPWTRLEDLYRSDSIEKTMRFVERVVREFKDHSAIAGWILSNEISLVKKAVSREEALALLRAFSRTVKSVSETWNPITGCLHNCVYCWARRLALTKLRIFPRYRDGFVPRFNAEELRRSFKPNTLVFCCDMGDIFSPGVRDEWVYKVLEHIARYPKTMFLLLTKNPERYKDFLSVMPKNVILGATIETDNDELYLRHKISQAPLPSQRIKAMKQLQWNLKMVSIEPILDFTDRFDREVAEIKPILVYIGYDNYGNRLPEPPLRKTVSLIKFLEARGIEVRTKTLRPAWYETSLNRV